MSAPPSDIVVPLLHLASQLIASRSPTPPGDTRAAASVVGDFMGSAGFRITIHAPEGAPQSQSVVAEFGHGRPRVLYHAHIDTVPVASPSEWRSDPFVADSREGRLYGLGACDDKGVLAAMMLAASRTRPAIHHGTLVVIGAADEEAAGVDGTGFLRDTGVLDGLDFAVIGEQTHNRVALSHKGTCRATVAVRGRSVHATNPDRGVNAIGAMAQIVQEVERYHEGLKRTPHPLLGSGTASVNLIRGGQAGNVVPETCEATIDRRLVPPESMDAVVKDIEALLRVVETARPDCEIRLASVLTSPWFETAGVDPFTRTFMEVIQTASGHDPGPVGYLPGSDAKFFMPTLSVTPTIVFGPGSYEQAHAVNEWVAVSELVEAAQILEAFAGEVLT